MGWCRSGSLGRSSCLSLRLIQLRQIRESQVLIVGDELGSLVLLDVLLAALDTLLSLLVHGLKLTNAHQVNDGVLVLFC